MTLFLNPLARTLKKLCIDGEYDCGFVGTELFQFLLGVTVSLPDKAPFTCKVVLAACTCDLPARAQVMNMAQFNAYYGCNFCLQKGK